MPAEREELLVLPVFKVAPDAVPEEVREVVLAVEVVEAVDVVAVDPVVDELVLAVALTAAW